MYIYQADLYCDACGEAMQEQCDAKPWTGLPDWLISIAASWHGGQSSALYSLSSTGTIHGRDHFDDVQRELESMLTHDTTGGEVRRAVDWLTAETTKGRPWPLLSDEDEVYDSDFYPKFVLEPGESDSMQHCGGGEDCPDGLEHEGGATVGCWLESELTDEGWASLFTTIVEWAGRREHGEFTETTELMDCWIEAAGNAPETTSEQGMAIAILTDEHEPIEYAVMRWLLDQGTDFEPYEIGRVRHSPDRYSTPDEDVLVATDERADELWDEALDRAIDDVVCAEMTDTAKRYFDREQWKNDAKHDGRAHELATQDGEEYEVEYAGVTYYIYR